MKMFFLNSVLFSFLTLIQVSVLPHVGIWWSVPNLILLAVTLINLLEPGDSSFGIVAAFVGGLFWDIFSFQLLGLGASTLVIVALLIKIGKQSYVRIPLLS
ncbi:MAG: rod shape-determining protein MreD [Candidatus Yanofskybacteria bacterium]|nr:rod shape-determining protein MreD [Candidatus Yanofskybacteria bacterium]